MFLDQHLKPDLGPTGIVSKILKCQKLLAVGKFQVTSLISMETFLIYLRRIICFLSVMDLISVIQCQLHREPKLRNLKKSNPQVVWVTKIENQIVKFKSKLIFVYISISSFYISFSSCLISICNFLEYFVTTPCDIKFMQGIASLQLNVLYSIAVVQLNVCVIFSQYLHHCYSSLKTFICVTYVQACKVILLEDLALHFNLKTQVIIDRLESLQEIKRLAGDYLYKVLVYADFGVNRKFLDVSHICYFSVGDINRS